MIVDSFILSNALPDIIYSLLCESTINPMPDGEWDKSKFDQDDIQDYADLPKAEEIINLMEKFVNNPGLLDNAVPAQLSKLDMFYHYLEQACGKHEWSEEDKITKRMSDKKEADMLNDQGNIKVPVISTTSIAWNLFVWENNELKWPTMVAFKEKYGKDTKYPKTEEEGKKFFEAKHTLQAQGQGDGGLPEEAMAKFKSYKSRVQAIHKKDMENNHAYYNWWLKRFQEASKKKKPEPCKKKKRKAEKPLVRVDNTATYIDMD